MVLQLLSCALTLRSGDGYIRRMQKTRLEAFSDGVIAILITIMVLELKVPHGADPSVLVQLWPVLLAYLLSFVYLGIYWNNHHHMFHTVKHVSGGILWANLHLLFWLSLVPFVTAWAGENHFEALPTALYGVPLLMSGVAYYVLQQVIIRSQGPNSLLKQATGRDYKGKSSPLLYVCAIGAAFFSPLLACAIYAGVALMWIIPDRRIERVLKD